MEDHNPGRPPAPTHLFFCLRAPTVEPSLGNLVLSPVVELCRPGRPVVRDVLRHSEGTLVLQVGGDAGRAKGVVPDLRLDSGVRRAARHQAVGVLPGTILIGKHREPLLGKKDRTDVL